MKNIRIKEYKWLIIPCIITLVMILMVVILFIMLNTDKNEKSDNQISKEKQIDILKEIEGEYWSNSYQTGNRQDRYNKVVDSMEMVFYFGKNGKGKLYYIDKEYLDNSFNEYNFERCISSTDFTYSIENGKLIYKESGLEQTIEFSISVVESSNFIIVEGIVFSKSTNHDYSSMCMNNNYSEETKENSNENNKENFEPQQSEESNSNNENNSGSYNSSNNINSNKSNDEIISLNVSVSDSLEYDMVYVNVKTNSNGCKSDIYLNGSKVINNGNLSIGLSDYSETFEVRELSIGNNSIKVNLIKDGNVVATSEKTYYFDSSKIPTPTFSISEKYNTYDSKAEVIVWPKSNGCNFGDKCKMYLYVDGVKQKNNGGFNPQLNIGDNTFTIELKNGYGKSSCQKLNIKRFEYNQNVDFTQLGKYIISDC